jgi:uncharacterized protein (DUF433 family)
MPRCRMCRMNEWIGITPSFRRCENEGQSTNLKWERLPLFGRIVVCYIMRGEKAMNENALLERITYNPQIFSGKPIIRGRRLAVEHILGMLAAGDSTDVLLQGYPWLEADDIQACLVYARRLVGHERIEPFPIDPAA